MSRSYKRIFATALAGIAAVAAALFYFASRQRSTTSIAEVPRVETVVDARSPLDPPFIMFRTLAPHDAHGRVAMMPLGVSEPARHVTALACARLHYAAGSGLCMVEEAHDTSVKHVVYTFDRSFARGRRIELAGVPIRARVSPDGQRAAVSVYGEEESPAGERLATESILIDVPSGRVLADLREFTVTNENHPPINGPVDIAGVTFQSDSNHFFATLSTATNRYLVAGSVNGRRLDVIGTGVANEALSPDGRRLIAKRPVGERGYWQLVVIDLETRSERVLNQGPKSVDDQVEWLDEAHVVYHDITDKGTGIWMLPADGTGGPRLLIADAFSPVIQRE